MNVVLSIVIPSNNRAELLDEAMQSILREQAFAERCEICVSDNSEGYATEMLVASKYLESSKVVYRRSSDSPSLDANVNQAVNMAHGEYAWIFGDDDLIVPGFLGTLVDYLEKRSPDILVLNSRSFQGDKIVEPSRLPLASEKIYGPEENDAFLADLGGYLTYVGGIVIKKRLWLEFFRERMIGTYFAHIDAICRAKPGRLAHYFPQPGISMRLHFQTWTGKHFEIWNVLFPAVIWGLEGYSDDAKQSVIPRYPLKLLRRILASRAYGRFNLDIWKTVLKPSKVASYHVKWLGLLVAVLPREWFRLLYILFIRTGRREHNLGFSPELARAQLGRTVK